MRSFSAAAAAAALVVSMGITAATARAEDPQVLVLPFASAEGTGGAGIERALQRSLAGQLGRTGSFKPIANADTAATDDLGAAISAAREAGASHVVYGYYEMRGDRLSVTANSVDVTNMRIMGGVNVERRSRDLWNAADALGTHVT